MQPWERARISWPEGGDDCLLSAKWGQPAAGGELSGGSHLKRAGRSPLARGQFPAMAAMNKSLAQGNKSYTHGKATKERLRESTGIGGRTDAPGYPPAKTGGNKSHHPPKTKPQ